MATLRLSKLPAIGIETVCARASRAASRPGPSEPSSRAARGGRRSAASGCARDTFNDVQDYNGYASTGFCTVDGVAISALAKFNVSSTVAAGTLGGVGAALKVTVTVQNSGDTLRLVGWRTDYASP